MTKKITDLEGRFDAALKRADKVNFKVVTGKEKYLVIDLVSNGHQWFDNKLEAYKHAAIIQNVLGHTYRLEMRS